MKLSLFKTVFVAVAIVVSLSGCQREQPIYDINNRPFLMAGNGVTSKELHDTVVQAVVDADWIVREDNAGYLIAEQLWRTHSASVRIEYTADDFSIHYHDSKNLLVGRIPEGMIHREYNLRVQALEKQIASALQRRKS